MAEIPTLKCVFCITSPIQKNRYLLPKDKVIQDAVTILEGNAVCNEHFYGAQEGLNSQSTFNMMWRSLFGNASDH